MTCQRCNEKEAVTQTVKVGRPLSIYNAPSVPNVHSQSDLCTACFKHVLAWVRGKAKQVRN